MIYIEKFFERIYQRIGDNTGIPARNLSFYRIFLGIFLLFLMPSYSWLTDVPPGFFKPNVLTLANFFDSLPNPWFFKAGDLIIRCLLILAILGIKSRIVFFSLFILTLVYNSFAYSLGKIDHSIFISLTFLFFAVTNGGTSFALLPDKPLKGQKVIFAVFALTLIFAFFTAGYEKALNWLDFDLGTSGVLSWFYSNYFSIDSTKLAADYFFHTPHWIVELMDYTAVIFETTGIFFLLYSRKSWRIYLIAAAVFHLINGLVLNIPFTSHLAVYGIWLLAPVFFKYKWTPFFFLLPFLLPGLFTDAALWSLVFVFSVFGWCRRLYFE